MIGPFITALGGFTHVLVAIDKFVQYRQFGPTPHPRRIQLAQAQLEMGRTVRCQADFKIGILSTTIPRGPRRPKFFECSEPAQVLPMKMMSRDSCSPSA
jgi:hypothetical protein